MDNKMKRLSQMAEIVFGNSEKAEKWLTMPNPKLDNETPQQHAAKDKQSLRSVTQALKQIHHGIVG